MGRVLSMDPITKVTKVMHYANVDDSFVIESRQNADEVIERNKALYNTYRGAWEPHGEWGDRYAEIPTTVWGDLLRRGIAQCDKRLRRWLDDRDNQFFRCRPGRLSR